MAVVVACFFNAISSGGRVKVYWKWNIQHSYNKYYYFLRYYRAEDPLTLYYILYNMCIDTETDNCRNFFDNDSLNIDVPFIYLFVCFARLCAGIRFETIQSETSRLISQRFSTFRRTKKSERQSWFFPLQNAVVPFAKAHVPSCQILENVPRRCTTTRRRVIRIFGRVRL